VPPRVTLMQLLELVVAAAVAGKGVCRLPPLR
jgi:hypothetical protein